MRIWDSRSREDSSSQRESRGSSDPGAGHELELEEEEERR